MGGIRELSCGSLILARQSCSSRCTMACSSNPCGRLFWSAFAPSLAPAIRPCFFACRGRIFLFNLARGTAVLVTAQMWRGRQVWICAGFLPIPLRPRWGQAISVCARSGFIVKANCKRGWTRKDARFWISSWPPAKRGICFALRLEPRPF